MPPITLLLTRPRPRGTIPGPTCRRTKQGRAQRSSPKPSPACDAGAPPRSRAPVTADVAGLGGGGDRRVVPWGAEQWLAVAAAAVAAAEAELVEQGLGADLRDRPLPQAVVNEATRLEAARFVGEAPAEERRALVAAAARRLWIGYADPALLGADREARAAIRDRLDELGVHGDLRGKLREKATRDIRQRLDAIDREGGTLPPGGAIRLGQSGVDRNRTSQVFVQEMRRLLEEAVRAGRIDPGDAPMVIRWAQRPEVDTAQPAAAFMARVVDHLAALRRSGGEFVSSTLAEAWKTAWELVDVAHKRLRQRGPARDESVAAYEARLEASALVVEAVLTDLRWRDRLGRPPPPNVERWVHGTLRRVRLQQVGKTSRLHRVEQLTDQIPAHAVRHPHDLPSFDLARADKVLAMLRIELDAAPVTLARMFAREAGSLHPTQRRLFNRVFDLAVVMLSEMRRWVHEHTLERLLDDVANAGSEGGERDAVAWLAVLAAAPADSAGDDGAWLKPRVFAALCALQPAYAARYGDAMPREGSTADGAAPDRTESGDYRFVHRCTVGDAGYEHPLLRGGVAGLVRELLTGTLDLLKEAS